MANRRPQPSGRRMDFVRNDRSKSFRSGVSPWQGGGPGANDLPNLLPLGGGSTEATLALASNIINLLQPRQNPVPSLLDMPIRRDFGPNMGRYDRGFVPNRMGNQGNFRRTGNYNRAGERINTNRKPFRPNDGPKQPIRPSMKKEADSKTKLVKESGETNRDGGETSENKEEVKKDVPKTRYDDINSQLLRCHICNKSMWDGRSFENHLSGRAHAIMMQKTAESYALTADTMRQEFKIREIKRTRKTGQQPARDFYCAMCDMYAGDGAIHRTTVGHRKLKKYLHPMCAGCHKEMPTRIELDEHRLTAEHLRELQNKQEVVTKPKPEDVAVMVISTLSMEQMYLREDRPRRRYDRNGEKNKDGEKDDTEPKQEGEEDTKKEEGETEEKKDTEKESPEPKKTPLNDNENTILDYKEGDDVTGLTPEMLPAYSIERGVGSSFLSEFRCYQCQLCRKLLDSEETAQVHLRTWRHHQLFVRLLNEKSGKELQQQQQPETGNKRPHHSEESGNWKRRKTSQNDNEDDERDDDALQDDEPEQKTVKSEVQTEAEAEDELMGNGDSNLDTPQIDDDWEQSVDEILKDEQENREKEEEEQKQEPVAEPEAEVKEEPAPEVEQQPEVKIEALSTKVPPKSPKTPRGRGRGRRRN